MDENMETGKKDMTEETPAEAGEKVYEEKEAPAEAPKETPAEAPKKAPADLLKQGREFVVPGDAIVNSMSYLPGRNCFREGESIYAKRLGVVSVSGRVVSVISLNSTYSPRSGDMVIGEVVDIHPNGWVLDLDACYEGYLPLAGVREYIDTNKTDLATVYNIGDTLYAKVNFIKKDSIQLSMQDPMCRKFRGGRIIKVNAAKVPRIIGKQGSMVNMVKDKANTRINIGQNGIIWIEGGNEELVIKAIHVIDKEAYKNGLTDRVSKFLEENG